jgi:hypothetical protein
MNYETTDIHPQMKAGQVIDQDNDNYQFTLGGKTFFTGLQTIEAWESNGYIKEVEELEFTKSDMIDFLCNNSDKCKEHASEILNNWLKQRNK